MTKPIVRPEVEMKKQASGCGRRWGRGWAGLLAVVCSALLGAPGCRPPATRNLVLIVVDTLRQDRVTAYGYHRDTTPNLARLAAAGAVADGLSPTSWTKPATAALLTGLHPLRLRVTNGKEILGPEAVTLAEVLRQAGYQTLGISANDGWISRDWGFAQGFDEFYTMSDFGYSDPTTAPQVNDEVLPRALRLHPPYFLYVHYVDPHVPYRPPTAGDGSALDERLASLRPFRAKRLRPFLFTDRPPQLVRDASDLYDGEVRLVDGEIGELLAGLAAAGLMESTVTVVTSDHGEEFEEHGRLEHGHTLYSELTRVPLIIHGPGVVVPGTRLPTMSLMDVFPTVLQLIGQGKVTVAHPQALDGRSRAAALRSGVADPNPTRELLLHLDFQYGHALALVRGDQKLILGQYPYVKGFFDQATDPEEQHNLLSGSQSPAAFAELSRRLAVLHNTMIREALPAVRATIDGEVAARLRALGYLDASPRFDAKSFIPPRIRPADPTAGGLLGWEGPRGLKSCITIAEPRDLPHLLHGWHPEDNPKGRWTWATAAAALAVPRADAGRMLVVRGINHRPGLSFSMKIALDGEELVDCQLARGPFELEIPVQQSLAPGATAIIGIQVDPPYVPAEHGMGDHRTLGVFLSGLCLQPTTTRGDPEAETNG